MSELKKRPSRAKPAPADGTPAEKKLVLIPDEVRNMTDNELFKALSSLGYKPGPMTQHSRPLFERIYVRLLSDDSNLADGINLKSAKSPESAAEPSKPAKKSNKTKDGAAAAAADGSLSSMPSFPSSVAFAAASAESQNGEEEADNQDQKEQHEEGQELEFSEDVVLVANPSTPAAAAAAADDNAAAAAAAVLEPLFSGDEQPPTGQAGEDGELQLRSKVYRKTKGDAPRPGPHALCWVPLLSIIVSLLMTFTVYHVVTAPQ